MFDIVSKDGTLIGVILSLLGLLSVLVYQLVKAYREVIRVRKESAEQVLQIYRENSTHATKMTEKFAELVVKNNEVLGENKFAINALTKSVETSTDVMSGLKDFVTQKIIESTHP